MKQEALATAPLNWPVVDPICRGPALMQAARAWKLDHEQQGEAANAHHQNLIHDLAWAFTNQTAEEINAMCSDLEVEGFFVGFERDASRVTIAYDGLTHFKFSQVITAEEALAYKATPVLKD